MKKELKIFLFRHGRTFYNEKHIFTGWKNSSLSPNGIKDAKTLAKKLKNKQIDLAFSSDLKRAKQTLKEVLKYHPGIKTIVDKRLKERSYGTLEGTSHQKFVNEKGEEALKKVRRNFYARPPKGESIEMVEKRVILFIKYLLKIMKSQEINVAISAHGNSIRPFRKYFEKLSVEKTMKIEQPYDNYCEYTLKV